MITVKQIFYHPSQEAGLDYLGYYNPPPGYRSEQGAEEYIFLESRCISKAIRRGEHKGLEKFGLVGTEYRKKIKECKNWSRDISNRSTKEFSPERFSRFCILNKDADLIAFAKHPPHSVFKFAEKYHPGITKLAEDTLSEIGFDINVRALNDNPVYFNYFVATPQVLEGFVKELLNPVMDLATNNPEFKKRYWRASGYYKKFPPHLKRIYETAVWPFHPFIAERLISLYISKYSLKIKSL